MKINIFNLIKEKKYEEFKNIIIKNKNINFDIYDENNNQLIFYLVNLNLTEIIDLIIKTSSIRLDIIDLDGRTILYNLIRYNNIELLKILLEYNKKNIGISIIDIKDKFGYTSLHYGCIFNNLEIVKILYSYGADPYIVNNDNLNMFHIALHNNRNDILKYFLDKKVDLSFVTDNNEIFLQLAIIYKNFEIIDLIIDDIDDINHQEGEYGLTSLHQSISINNIVLIKKLINRNADINIQDFFGNTPLMYAISQNYISIIKYFLTLKDLNYNLNNLDGDTALHSILKSYNPENIIINKIIKILVEKTDLSVQNNDGDTCLYLLIKHTLFITYNDILEKKELNIFISNLNNEISYDLIKDDLKILDCITKSYYNILTINKNKLLLTWEKDCGINSKIKKDCLNKSLSGS